MASKTFILIETRVGRARQVTEALRPLEGVRSADVVTGTFDVIALVEAPDMSAVAELVTSRVQAIDGVLRTITCVAA